MREDFRELLKKQRKYLGITQKELAIKTGLSEITIRKYENGERTPKIEQLDKISQALDCDILDFMSIEEQNMFFLNEAQIYLNKVLSSKNHPANNIASTLLTIITQISSIAPLDLINLENEDEEYCNLVGEALSQFNDSLFVLEDSWEDYKIFMTSLAKFIKENYKNYFLKNYKNEEGDNQCPQDTP